MIMPIRYTEEMILDAKARRGAGTKWAVLDEEYGDGIRMAVSKHDARVRKARSRAATEQRVELPLPPGTAAALARICEASGDSPVGTISLVIHTLDDCRANHPEIFKYLTTPPRTDVTNVVERHAHRIGAPVPGDEDE